MQYRRLVILVVIITEVVNAFHNVNINNLLVKIDQNQFDLSNIREKWIEQPLDHFHPNRRTLKMRYFENLKHWQPNGTIFVFITGEAEIHPNWIATSEGTLIGQLAADSNGAMFAPEHRYYGKTMPNITDYDIIEYYKYLGSRQALADFAGFIKAIKKDSKFKWSKVVVVGGSYGGNLAVWLKELYPSLVDAAVASSAPVLAKKDFHEYLDVVRYTLHKYGTKDCLGQIRTTYERYEQLLGSSHGMQTLKEELNICPSSDLTVFSNQQLLFYTQYNKLMAALLSSRTPDDVKSVCKQFQSPSELRDKPGCINVNIRTVMFSTPWINQICKEFGYFPTTSSEKQPFVHWNPVRFYLKFCTYLVRRHIEKTVDKGIAMTNKRYGGRSPKVSKVVFTHGDMDPWGALGVLKDLGPDAPVTMVNGTGHCGILVRYPGEARELTQNREYVKRLIKKWISAA